MRHRERLAAPRDPEQDLVAATSRKPVHQRSDRLRLIAGRLKVCP
jgi:hypothetical protein